MCFGFSSLSRHFAAMPPGAKDGEMEPDTQLKRARLSLIGSKPVQHRPSSWNGENGHETLFCASFGLQLRLGAGLLNPAVRTMSRAAPNSANAGFSYLEKACSNKSKLEQEDERSSPNEDDNSSPASRPTRRKLADGTVHEV